MVLDRAKLVMTQVEQISKSIGDVVSNKDYYIEDLGKPHKAPTELPEGYCVISLFVYGNDNEYQFLKVYRVDARKNDIFSTQQYDKDSKYSLAKSLLADKEFISLGVKEANVKEWMLENLRRIDIYIKESVGRDTLGFVDAFIVYALRPRYTLIDKGNK